MKFNQRPLLVATLLVISAVAQYSYAQAPTDPQPSQQVTEELLVVASKLPIKSHHVGSSVALLTRDQIERLGDRYAADLFRHVPGVAVSRTGGFGGVTQIRLRGGEANHTLVLIDGIDVSSAGTAEFDFSSLLASDIERIEVLRGAQSGLFGSNALAGVIYIETKKPTQMLEAAGELELGENASRELGVSVSGGNQVLQGRVSYAQRRSEFDLSRDNTLGAEDDKDKNDTLGGQFVARFGDSATLRGFARYAQRETDTDGFDFSGGLLQGLAIDDNSGSDTEDLTLGLVGEVRLSEQLRAKVTLEQTETETDGGFFGNEASREKIKLDAHWQWAGDGQVVQRSTLFSQWQQETFKNLYPLDPSQAPTQERNSFGFGVEHSLVVGDNLAVSASLRLDDNNKFKDATTYSVSGSYQIVPNTRLHASYGRGVTNPTFFEQFGFTPSLFVGNPALQPEQAQGWDIGVRQSFADGSGWVDIIYFESDLEREIQSVFPSVVNIARDSERRGVELSFAYEIATGTGLEGAYTYTDAQEPGGVEEVRRPKNTASLSMYTHLLDGKIQASASFTYNDKQLDTDFRNFFTNGFVASRTELDSHIVGNLKIAYRPTELVQAYVRIENLFDQDYEQALSYAAPGRGVYVGIKYLFSPKR